MKNLILIALLGIIFCAAPALADGRNSRHSEQRYSRHYPSYRYCPPSRPVYVMPRPPVVYYYYYPRPVYVTPPMVYRPGIRIYYGW